MISTIRRTYNDAFSTAQYGKFLAQIDQDFPGQLDFRVAETPVFVSRPLTDKLLTACADIVDTLTRADFRTLTDGAIPPEKRVPNEPADDHTQFIALDFAVCRDETDGSPTRGELTPQLIELQGFPSLYGFQTYLANLFRSHFTIPDTLSHLFSVADDEAYISELRRMILGDCDPQEVILLDIYPERQKTRIDFALTELYTGVAAVCLTRIKKNGRALFYEKDGQMIRIRRIYNRLIDNDLLNFPDLRTEFSLTDDVDVTWVGHPNWFYRISKYTLPLLKSPYVPASYFLSDLTDYPADLDQYVLKPLFSFAGSGVRLRVTAADLDAIPPDQRSGYLLQRKVRYAPVVQAPDGGVKCEIRLLFLWPADSLKPILVTNLCRLSRGEMIGVRFNKDFDWVGGTVGFFAQ